MEPTVATGLFAAESENEFTEGILLERQSYIQEKHMLEAAVMGCLQGVPDGKDVRMNKGK